MYWNTNEGGIGKRTAVSYRIRRLRPDVLFAFEANNAADAADPFLNYLGSDLRKAGYRVPLVNSDGGKRKTVFAAIADGHWEIDPLGREGYFTFAGHGHAVAGIHPYSQGDGETGFRAAQIETIKSYAANPLIKFIGGDFNQDDPSGDVHSIISSNFHSLIEKECTYSNVNSLCLDWLYARTSSPRCEPRRDHTARNAGESDHSAQILTIFL
jgi:hypothetical protein